MYFHASVGSHFFRSLAELEEVCITVTLADAIVVAKTAFNHSINYRSVVLWGKPEVVDDPAEKYAAFRALTEKMVPGSWDYLLPMTDKEMAKTMALKVPIAEASAKIRQGPPFGEVDGPAHHPPRPLRARDSWSTPICRSRKAPSQVAM